jgi:hypothetical protein
MSQSKAPDTPENSAHKGVQPTMECKSMKVMNKTKMQKPQYAKVWNPIGMSQSKAPHTPENSARKAG